MRMVFGVLSLLIALGIVSVLAKKQLGAVSASPPSPGPSVVSGTAVAVPTGTPQQQLQQVQQAVEAAVQQQQRSMPDDIK
jgi:Na+-transporting methylmalonyl-CoA/oxaloacetate decarboxylase gamma subunit